MTSLRCWHDGIQTDASEFLLESRALPLLSNWVLKGWGLSVACLLLLTHFIVVGNGGLTQLSLEVQLQGELKVTLQKISRFMISGLGKFLAVEPNLSQTLNKSLSMKWWGLLCFKAEEHVLTRIYMLYYFKQQQLFLEADIVHVSLYIYVRAALN